MFKFFFFLFFISFLKSFSVFLFIFFNFFLTSCCSWFLFSYCCSCSCFRSCSWRRWCSLWSGSCCRTRYRYWSSSLRSFFSLFFIIIWFSFSFCNISSFCFFFRFTGYRFIFVCYFRRCYFLGGILSISIKKILKKNN